MSQARQSVWLLLFVSSCFHPTYDHPTCGPGGECPKGLICSAQQTCEAPGDDPPGAGPDSGFDYAQCPASYNVQLFGPTRYRLIPEGNSAWQQSDTCMVDLPGATHLVVLETMPEVMAVSIFVDTSPTIIAGNAVWVGGVQQRTEQLPDFGWLAFDGAPLIAAWAAGEPNDGGSELDHSEQFVVLERTRRYLADRAGITSFGALCECDGKPVAAGAADAITANRPPT